MTRRRIAVLAIRVLALFVAFQGLRTMLHATDYVLLGGVELDAFFATGSASSVIVVALGMLLWSRAHSIAARALGEPRESQDQIDLAAADEAVRVDLSGLDAHAIAFTVLGVYLVAQGLVTASVAASQWIERLRPVEPQVDGGVVFGGVPFVEIRSSALQAFAYLGFGLALAFGARRLAAFFRRNWWASRGVSRVRRVELVDFDDIVRARLATEERADGDEDVALRLFDEEERPRATLMVEGGYEPRLVFSDETGQPILRLPVDQPPEATPSP